MTTDLIAFITARLAEDENHAKKDLHMLDRASSGGAWEYGVGYNLPYSELGEGGSIGRLTATYGRRLADGEPDQHNADVMLVARLVRGARRRAERVLREVEAKRRLLETIFRYEAILDREFGCCHSEEEIAAGQCLEPSTPYRAALRGFAVAWSDHPAYRPEWSL